MSTWHAVELTIVKRMWEAGESARETAGALSKAGFTRTRNAVIGLAYRMGYQRPLPGVEKDRTEAAPSPQRRARAKPVVTKIDRRPKPEPREPEPVQALAGIPAARLEPPVGGLSIMDLEHWHCRFVVSVNPSRFCGQDKAFGTSYCVDCAARVFTPEGVERLKAGKKPPQHVKAAA